MKILNQKILINNKKIPARVYEVNTPQYVFVTHHGLLSNKTSWKYLENWVEQKATIVSYDARVNGHNKMKASRLSKTYVYDLRDVVRRVKITYPRVPVVVIGSSWGAAVVAQYTKIYGKEIYRTVAWSIPYKWISAKANNTPVNKQATKNESVVYKTSTWGYFWKFLLMILFNVNTKSFTKLNIEEITDNKLLMRVNKIIKPQPTPVKLFWAAAKAIAGANANLLCIDKKYQNQHKMLYLQSSKDPYLTAKKMHQLQAISAQGVDVKIIDEGKHALQWEQKNNLNLRVFNYVWNWLNTTDKLFNTVTLTLTSN